MFRRLTLASLMMLAAAGCFSAHVPMFDYRWGRTIESIARDSDDPFIICLQKAVGGSQPDAARLEGRNEGYAEAARHMEKGEFARAFAAYAHAASAAAHAIRAETYALDFYRKQKAPKEVFALVEESTEIVRSILAEAYLGTREARRRLEEQGITERDRPLLQEGEASLHWAEKRLGGSLENYAGRRRARGERHRRALGQAVAEGRMGLYSGETGFTPSEKSGLRMIYQNAGVLLPLLRASEWQSAGRSLELELERMPDNWTSSPSVHHCFGRAYLLTAEVLAGKEKIRAEIARARREKKEGLARWYEEKLRRVESLHSDSYARALEARAKSLKITNRLAARYMRRSELRESDRLLARGRQLLGLPLEEFQQKALEEEKDRE